MCVCVCVCDVEVDLFTKIYHMFIQAVCLNKCWPRWGVYWFHILSAFKTIQAREPKQLYWLANPRWQCTWPWPLTFWPQSKSMPSACHVYLGLPSEKNSCWCRMKSGPPTPLAAAWAPGTKFCLVGRQRGSEGKAPSGVRRWNPGRGFC